MKKALSLAAVISALLPTISHAENNDFVFMLTNTKIENTKLDNGFKLQFHHYFNDNIGVELAHARYGKHKDDWETEKLSAFNFGIIAKSNSPESVNVFGKLGLSRWTVDYSGEYWGSGSSSDSDGYIGFGVNIAASSSTLFVIEFEKINLASSNTTSFNIGLGGTF